MADKKQSAPELVSDEDLDDVTAGAGPTQSDRRSWIFGYVGADLSTKADDPIGGADDRNG